MASSTILVIIVSGLFSITSAAAVCKEEKFFNDQENADGVILVCKLSKTGDFQEIPADTATISLSIDMNASIDFTDADLPNAANVRYMIVDVMFQAYFSRPKFAKQSLPKLEYLEIKRFQNSIEANRGVHRNNLILEPNYFSGLTSLKSLKLEDAAISILPAKSAFDGLPNLKQLDLSKNEIQNIPVNAFLGCSSLKELRLHENYINYYTETDIRPGSFNGLTSLNWLNLGNNFIEKLDKGWFEGAEDIEFILIKKNEIETIDVDAFKDLNQLKYLIISENKIEYIPPDVFSKAPILNTLDLTRNKIRNIYADDFKGLPMLEFLYLQENQLQFIDNNAFQGLPNLKELHLMDNSLGSISDDSFNGINQVTTLDLSQNRINFIEKAAFQGLPSLETLKLNDNRLQKLENGSFDGNGALFTVHLENNLWYCNCDVFWLLKWIQSKDWSNSKVNPYHVECVLPEKYVATTFLQLLGSYDYRAECDVTFVTTVTTTTTTVVTTTQQPRGNLTTVVATHEEDELLTRMEKIILLIGGNIFILIITIVLIIVCCVKRLPCYVRSHDLKQQCNHNDENYPLHQHVTPTKVLYIEKDYVFTDPQYKAYNVYQGYSNSLTDDFDGTMTDLNSSIYSDATNMTFSASNTFSSMTNGYVPNHSTAPLADISELTDDEELDEKPKIIKVKRKPSKKSKKYSASCSNIPLEVLNPREFGAQNLKPREIRAQEFAGSAVEAETATLAELSMSCENIAKCDNIDNQDPRKTIDNIFRDFRLYARQQVLYLKHNFRHKHKSLKSKMSSLL